MRWRLVVLIACLPLAVVQVTHTQNSSPVPSCERACRVNPFTAPASCDCNAPGGPTTTPAPAAPAPQAPVPAPARAPAEPSVPASAAPAVPTCERACRVNPFTAPAGCACRTGIDSGSAASAPPPAASALPASSSGPLEDGLITVREILDYMDTLYRERIAGVEHYYFLERIEYAQAASAARASGGFVLTSASPAQSPPLATASPAPVTALRTREKVTVDGRPVMKELTPEERRRRQQRATAATGPGADAGQQLLEDPSLFFGVLAKAAETFVGGAAASPFLAMQEELRSVSGGAGAPGEDPFAEDVLAELERLRQAEAAEGRDREMYLGYYARGGQTFQRGPRCEGRAGCTMEEIERFRRTVFKTEPLEGQAGAASVQILYNYIFCIVWRPGAASLEAFTLSDQPDTSTPSAAELWLPIPDYRSPAEGPGSKADPFLGDDNHDRPIRMKIVFLTPTNAGFEGMVIERIYDDYRRLAAGAVEPHEVRQALGRELCGSKADASEVARIVLSRNLWRKADDQADTAEEACAATLGLPVHDPTRALVALATKKRKGFVVNEDWPSPEREAVLIGEPW